MPHLLRPGRLALKLAISVILFSAGVALLFTVMQAGAEREQAVRRIDALMEQIETAYVASAVENLWVMDQERLDTQLQGILRLPDIVMAAIRVDGATLRSYGQPLAGPGITRTFPLQRMHRGQLQPIGELVVAATYEHADRRTLERLFDLLLANSITIVLAAVFMLFVFYRLIGRHIDQIARFALEQAGSQGSDVLKLHRIEPAIQDELTILSDAINTMRGRLLALTEAESRRADELEKEVGVRTEQLRIAKEMAEAASRAKSSFLSSMSHELRTPMNAIMGMTDLAMRHAIDPKQRDQLTKVMQAAQRLLDIINDILDLSKIEADRLSLQSSDFRLGEVIENLKSLVGHQLAAKRLGLNIAIPAALNVLVVRGDPLRLGQILLNLVGNAIKFTDQGAISLRVSPVREEDGHVVLRFEIEDTGIGIAPHDQVRLFNAFEQADNTLTRRYGGTGLGLAISKRLVNMMGGEIGMTSAVGQGSTFWFTLRLTKSRAAELPAATAPAAHVVEETLKARHAGARILLAEDEPINQEVTRKLLEEIGLAVDVADDGAEAVEMARRTAYDTILMDMQMPNLNGIDATRAIRAGTLNGTTPILAMTANAFAEDREACLAAGMSDHLAKPVTPDVLFATLLQWLDRR